MTLYRIFDLAKNFLVDFTKSSISGGTSHSPRRTGITNLADKGVSVRVLQSIARHSNISTPQCHIDVNDLMKRKAIDLI